MLEIKYIYSILPFLLDYYEVGGLPTVPVLWMGLGYFFTFANPCRQYAFQRNHRLKKKASANLVMYDVYGKICRDNVTSCKGKVGDTGLILRVY
jgi:hypothetical protein